MDNIAPMLVFITLILTVGGVFLLRPLTKQLGSLLKAITEQKRSVGQSAEVARLQEALNRIENRLEMVEERQQFAEELLGRRGAVPLPRSVHASEADVG